MINILIYVAVVVMFIVMIAVIIRGNQAKAIVVDDNNNLTIKKARIKDGKLSFKYNSHSKAGVTTEDNKYRQLKKKVYWFVDINDTLIPINSQKISEKKASLNLSTSQEKRYEIESMVAVSEKIDNTWLTAIKPLAIGFVIVMFASIVSIVMINNASEYTPVVEEQTDALVKVAESMQRLVESNEELVGGIENSNSEQDRGDNIPR